MELANEIWQVDTGGQIYEATNFDELTQWITDGTLLPQDKVRKGNLRWIEAHKVPTLHKFFNANELGAAGTVVSTTTVQTSANTAQTQNFNVAVPPPFQTFNEPPPPQVYQDIGEQAQVHFCVLHSDAKAKYHCETCTNYFCKACPQQNTCPMCGAMCKTLDIPVVNQAFAPVNSTAFVAQPIEDESISPEVGKAAYWFYAKAVLTVINSVLLFSGVEWSFALGMTVPLIIHSLTLIVSAVAGFTNMSLLNAAPVLVSFICAGIVALLGRKASFGKKWALILGLIIFSFDALLYLASFSIIGIAVHAFGIYTLISGLRSLKK